MFFLLPYANEFLIEAGCDEAGRGCLAGPVVAAAVILPKTFRHPLLTDSKLLSHQKRHQLRTIIEEEAIAFNVGFVSPVEIDQINILKASFLAMHRALDGLFMNPDWLMIDGNRFDSYKNIPHTCVVKGDAKFLHIAAASILAKTYRDQYMHELHQTFPFYQWDKNKGYPTKEHRTAIRQFGVCEHHRKSFTLIAPEQLTLF